MGDKKIWVLAQGKDTEVIKYWTTKPSIFDLIEIVGQVTKKEREIIQEVIDCNFYTSFKVGGLSYNFEEICLEREQKSFFLQSLSFLKSFFRVPMPLRKQRRA